MADKELRGMNRTELIEIIYALQQNERMLRAENEQLRRQLDDRVLRMEKAGSIAEAALSLNHIFEDAEAAAQQYLDSVRAMGTMEALPAEKTEGPSSPARAEAEGQSGPEETEEVAFDREDRPPDAPETERQSAGGDKIKAVYHCFSPRRKKE